jgi:hypothetical protein
LALTPPALPPRVMQPAAKTLLVTSAGVAQTLAPGLSCTPIGTIPLPVIAAPADPLLALTTRAIEHSVGADDRTDSTPPKAGQSLPTESLSPLGQALSTIGRELPRRPEECFPWAFTFCTDRPYYCARTVHARRRRVA